MSGRTKIKHGSLFSGKKTIKVMTLGERLKKLGLKEVKSPKKQAKCFSKKRKKFAPEIFFYKATIKKNRITEDANAVDYNFRTSYKNYKINESKSNRKLRKKRGSQLNTLTSDSKESSQKTLDEKCSSIESLQSFEGFNKIVEGNINQTIFISLDFMEDCQNYNKSFMKALYRPNVKYKKRKNLRNVSSYEKLYKNSKDLNESQLSVGKKKIFKKNKNAVAIGFKEKIPKTEEFHYRKPEPVFLKEVEAEPEEPSLKDEPEIEQKNYLVKNPLNVKTPSEDISTVDRKYIESLLSIANCNKKKKKENIINSKIKNEEKTYLKNIEKKNKSSKKYFYESIKRSIQLKNEKCLPGEQKKIHSTSNKAQSFLLKKYSPWLIRDFTKSEMQIQLFPKKKYYNPKIPRIKTEKETGGFKLDIENNRKKRKPIRIKDSESKHEYNHLSIQPFSDEVLKTSEVQELWRRETPAKSENSLSSHASTTDDECEESKPNDLGLENYQMLREIVKNEVNNIYKTFIRENSENLDKGQGKIHEPRLNNEEPKKIKTVCKTPKTSLPKSSSLKKNETETNVIIIKNNTEPERPQSPLDYPERPKSPQPRTINHKPNTPERKTRVNKKNPSDTVKNWSILHRLEQAFLVLGSSPGSERKNKHAQAKSSKTDTSKKEVFRKGKKIQKGKTVVITKEEPNQVAKSQEPAFTKTSKVLWNQSSDKQDKLEKKKTKNAYRVEFRNSFPTSDSTSEENSSKPSSEQLFEQANRGYDWCKTLQKVSTMPKIDEFQSQYSNEDLNSEKTGGDDSSLKSEPCDIESDGRKSSITPELSPNESQNLDRKKTYDVILPKELSEASIGKWKNFGRKSEQYTIKKRFSSNKSVESQNEEFRNLQIKRSESSQNSQKETLDSKPLKTYERYTNANERQLSRGNQESPSRSPANSTQDKFKNTIEFDDIPHQVLTKKNVSNQKQREVKERSILSMRGNKVSKPNFGPKQFSQKTTSNATSECEPSKNKTQETKTRPTINYNLITSSPIKDDDIQPKNTENESINKGISSEAASSFSSISLIANESLQDVKPETEDGETKTTKPQSPWENDIRQYRAIVKEIISQYKRISGFLKQNEHSETFPDDDEFFSKYDEDEEYGDLYRQSQITDINEYRKKVISEYRALTPIEYKTQALQAFKGFKRRNLSIVKTTDKDVDLDVKDYEPITKKILDSQLYVDRENLHKRNEASEKSNEKKSSLQEVIPSKNEKKSGECWPDCTAATQKAFSSLPETPLSSDGELNLKGRHFHSIFNVKECAV